MLESADQAINQFYRQKDYELFKVFCAKQFDLPEVLKEYIQAKGLTLVEEENKTYPSRTWLIKFADYKNGEFEVSHTTKLQISKVALLFFIRHEFIIPSKDPDTLESELKGWDGQAFTLQQFDLAEEIIKVLSEKGYHEVIYGSMIEVVEGFKIPEGVTNLGRNVTVEHLLFMDIFNILKNDSNASAF